MEDYTSVIKELEGLEKELVFKHFDSEDALKIGMELIEEAKRRNNKICISLLKQRQCHEQRHYD